jgi:ABC-type sugar transport system permease subunit
MVYVLHIFDSYQSWLGNPNYAIGAILAPHVWKEVPLATILLLAGISTIPSSLYEAAKLDGANVLARFRRITLPMLRPIIQLILVYETIQGITSFAYVFVLTGGGPGYATTTLSWLVWMTSFSFGDFGQGSCVAVIMSIIALLLTLLYFRLLPTKEFGSVAVR